MCHAHCGGEKNFMERNNIGHSPTQHLLMFCWREPSKIFECCLCIICNDPFQRMNTRYKSKGVSRTKTITNQNKRTTTMGCNTFSLIENGVKFTTPTLPEEMGKSNSMFVTPSYYTK